MRIRFVYISIVLLGFAVNSEAQNAKPSKDTVIKGSTIEIIQSYKPEIKQAQKPEMSVSLPPTDTSHPQFEYTVPKQSLFYTYSSPALSPLALGKDSSERKMQNYAKIGAGNISTIYLDAGLSKLTWKDYEAAIHLHHISQDGTIQYQQTSLSGIEAEGAVHKNGNAWHAFIDGSRYQYHYYGYDHDLYQPTSDSVTQTFSGFHVGADMQNEKPGYKGFNYHPSVFASYYKDSHGASETGFGFSIPVNHDFDSSLQLLGAINANISGITANGQSTGNSIFQIVPGVYYHKALWNIMATISPTFGKDNIFLLPNIVATYKLAKDLYSASAGWQGSLVQNTYEQLSTENPYMYNSFPVHQTHRDELFAAIKGNVSNHISFSGRLSWWQLGNLPIYLNDLGDHKQFYIVYYDKVNAISLQAAAQYDIANVLSVGLSATYYSFSGSSSKVYEVAPFTMKGNLSFRPIPELICSAYLSFLSGIPALDENQQTITLPSAFDIGGNAECMIIPRLSAFLQINNLLNNKYQRWLSYQAYGINVYGGIRLKF